MRQRNGALLLVGILALGATGCELLVDFDRSLIDQDAGGDSGATEQDGAPAADAAADTAPGYDSAAADTSVTPEDGGADSSAADANTADSAELDSTVVNSGEVDSNVADSHEVDSNVADSHEVNSNVADSNAPDSNVADSNIADTNVPDTNVVDTGVDSGFDAADADVIGMSLLPATFDFTSVEYGAPSTEKQFTLKNTGNVTTGVPAPSFTGANAGDFALTTNTCTAALAPGGTCTLGVTFTPSVLGGESASLSVTATQGGTQTVTLSGTGANDLTLTPQAGTDFGTVTAGTASSALAFRLTNGGGVTSGKAAITFTGTNKGDFSETDDCPAGGIAPSAFCTINVTVTASAVGARTATLNATATPGGIATGVPLTANGAVPFALAPAAFDFGTVATGESATYSFFTLTNTGAVTSGVPTLVLSDTTNYSFATNCTAPIAAGAACTFGVQYAPAVTSLGATPATLTANGGAGTAPVTDLAGNAAAGIAGASSLLTLTPTTQDFGSATGPQTFTLNNAAPAMITTAAPTIDGNDAANWALTGGTCTGTLAASSSCTYIVTYTPAATTNDYASFSVAVAGVGTLSASMTGNP